MSTDRHQRSVEITTVSDTLENTDRETKRETKHTHTRCLGHRRGLAATTAQVRDSELQESVAPSAAQSVHRARCGMGRLRTQGERSASLSSRHLKNPARRRETECLQITVAHLQPGRKQSQGWASGCVSAGLSEDQRRCSRIFTRMKSAMPRAAGRSSPRMQKLKKQGANMPV